MAKDYSPAIIADVLIEIGRKTSDLELDLSNANWQREEREKEVKSLNEKLNSEREASRVEIRKLSIRLDHHIQETDHQRERAEKALDGLDQAEESRSNSLRLFNAFIEEQKLRRQYRAFMKRELKKVVDNMPPKPPRDRATGCNSNPFGS
jgi:chromosome segregation ATPase